MADDAREEELLSFDEALQVLGTSRPTLYRLLSAGDVRGLKVGRQWRFRRSDLIAYMEGAPIGMTEARQEDVDTELAHFDSSHQAAGDEDIDAKVQRLAGAIVRTAIDRKTSDIHLEASHKEGQQVLLLRYRVDGLLQEYRSMPMSLHDALMARFKVMADMNAAVRGTPQDGRIPLLYGDKSFDLRVNTVPVTYGESLVIRILDRSSVLIGLDKLGLLPDTLEQIRRMIRQPNGILLFAGPSGCGKTTTVYSCLDEIATAETKTMTVEDPVEYLVHDCTQAAVHPTSGFDFPAAVRTILRQDPDVIFVGEMRDLATARLVMEAALTGHMVFSIMHAGDGPAVIRRLLDMGIEPHLLAPTLTGVVAQRLARRVCPECRVAVDRASIKGIQVAIRLATEGGYDVPVDAVFYESTGCEACRNRGYRGRIGLFEVIEANEQLSDAILRNAGHEEMTHVALDGGMRSLWADGMRKVVAGETTIDEVRRVVLTWT